MIDPGILNAVVFGLSAFVAALVSLLLLSRTARRRAPKRETIATSGDAMVFLIRGDRLIDANFAAHHYLDTFGQSGGGVAALRRAVHGMFDEAEALLAPGADGLRVTATSRDGSMQAAAETLGQTLRLKLCSRLSVERTGEDIHRLAAQESELDTLRQTTDSAPYLVWRETPGGTPIWVNRAYLDTVRDAYGPDRAAQWPMPRLFEGLEHGGHRRRRWVCDRT